MKTIHCILHGGKKKSKELQIFLANCQTVFGTSFRLSETIAPMHAAEIAKNIEEDIILIIGGDGTVNEVINGWISNKNAPKIAIIPYGTGNDFTRGIQANITMDNFIDALLNPQLIEVDVPFVKYDEEIRYFVNICDIGFGGEVVRKLTQYRRCFGTRFSYGLAILRTFIFHRNKKVKIDIGDKIIEGKILLLAFCNGPMFADGLIVQPDAKVNDQILHHSFFKNVTLIDYLINLSKVKRGIKLIHPEVEYGKNLDYSISSPKIIYGECDGELISGNTFKIGLSPHKFNLITASLKN